MQQRVIGKGTWLDRVGESVIKREKDLGRSLDLLRVESGLGASGIPHIGSLGDAARPYGVLLAIENLGHKSELIAYSDDMDALRKVPEGLPSWLSEWVGHPVSEIPDPFQCHKSYGEHMGSMLRDGLDKTGIRYTFKSGYEAYKSGILNEQIVKILSNAEKIGKQIASMLGQKKYTEVLPYFPICENCHRLNVARATRFDPDRLRVHYVCEGDQIGKRFVKGCGHAGEADVTKGEGKLSWKVEFAARWQALDIRFESYGKDLIDSVKVNDWISQNILGFPPPYHVKFEHFVERSGKKMSKSIGNVFTPQMWLRYGSPQSLLLLMFKRIVGTRTISPTIVPLYMDEYDWLEDVYFEKVQIPNRMERIRLRGLYEYVNHSRPPSSPGPHIPYQLLIQLCSIAPEENLIDFVTKKLVSYGVIRDLTEEVSRRIRYAHNYSKEVAGVTSTPLEINDSEARALADFSHSLSSESKGEEIQTKIFEVSKQNGIEPKKFFEILYKILIGKEKGPRLGPYIADIGPGKVAKIIEEKVRNRQ
jgi:lysyl-tRNA synthetase class 1